jgi:dihydroorotate dehydrogenase (NAD+) catalytic subunit
VIAASGTFGYGLEYRDLVDPELLGGFVTKTVTLLPRAGNPAPRIAEAPSGMINSIGLENVGIDVYAAEKLPALAGLRTSVIASIEAVEPADFARLAARLAPEARVDAIEVNISCPNVSEGGAEMSAEARLAGEVVRLVRRETEKPLLAKLTPEVTSIAEIARACEAEGADGLTAINTFRAMAVDVRRRAFRIAKRTGGLSGPAIRPLALAKVYEVVRAVKIPVVASGGISTAFDALEFLLVGAHAVQVGTATFRNPTAMLDVLSGIAAYLEEEGFPDLASIRGLLLREKT